MVKSRRQAYHAWGPPSGSNGDCLVSLMVSEPIKTQPDTIPSEQSCQSQIQEVLWGEHQLQSSCWESHCSGLTLVAFHAVRPLYDQISCLTFNLSYTVLVSEGKVYTWESTILLTFLFWFLKTGFPIKGNKHIPFWLEINSWEKLTINTRPCCGFNPFQ